MYGWMAAVPRTYLDNSHTAGPYGMRQRQAAGVFDEPPPSRRSRFHGILLLFPCSEATLTALGLVAWVSSSVVLARKRQCYDCILPERAGAYYMRKYFRNSRRLKIRPRADGSVSRGSKRGPG